MAKHSNNKDYSESIIEDNDSISEDIVVDNNIEEVDNKIEKKVIVIPVPEKKEYKIKKGFLIRHAGVEYTKTIFLTLEESIAYKKGLE